MSKLVYGKFGPGRNADNPKAPFSERAIPITLNGDEWFMILSVLSNAPPSGQFSDKGLELLTQTRRKFINQLKNYSK
jgi:hypothetical protein